MLSVFQQYYGELLAFVTAKLRCPQEAADVVQDTYARLLCLSQSNHVRRPRAFLYRIARNLSVDVLRKRRFREQRGVEMEALEQAHASLPNQEAILESKQRLEALYQAVAELPPKCRHVFLLHKFEQLSHAEIAAGLGISKNMVEKHIIKAMAHCRKRLDEGDGTPRASATRPTSQVGGRDMRLLSGTLPYAEP